MNESKSWNRTVAAPGSDRVLQILAETLCMRDPDRGLVKKGCIVSFTYSLQSSLDHSVGWI